MRILGYDISICFGGIGFSKTEYLYGWLIKRTTYGIGVSPKVPLVDGENKINHKEYCSIQEIVRPLWGSNLWFQLYSRPISIMFYREISKFNWVNLSYGDPVLSSQEEEYLKLFPWNRSKLIANKRIDD